MAASSKEHSLDIDQSEHGLNLMKNLQLQTKQVDTCDFIIQVGENKLHAHRNILRAGSEYFRAMLAHDSIEKVDGVVVMKEVDFQSVVKCIDYIYLGEAKVSEEGCEGLLHVAKIMQLDTLCCKIEKFLSSRLTPSSFYDIRKVALKYHCTALTSVCNDYALKNLGALSKEVEFKNLDEDFILFLMESRESPYAEGAKLSIALKWINADREIRKDHAKAVIERLQLHEISDEYKRFLAENEPVCYESSECMRSLLLSNTSRVESSLPAVPYHGTNNLVVMFSPAKNVLLGYRPATNALELMQPFEEEVNKSLSYTAVIHEKFVYVLMTTKKVFQFNFFEDCSSWIRLSDMELEHGKHMQAAVCKESIYVAGENSMERLDLSEMGWHIMEAKDVTLNECAVASYNDCVYIIGGKQSDKLLNSVSKYIPEVQEWNSVCGMKTKRSQAAAVAHKNILYVGGGHSRYYNNERKIESYDYTKDTWTTLMYDMLCRHTGFRMCVVDNKLYAVGSSEASPKQIIESYDLSHTEEWKKCDTGIELSIMPTASFAVFKPPKYANSCNSI